MNKRYFIRKMNSELKVLHHYDGNCDTCQLVPLYSTPDYEEFLRECFPEFDCESSSINFFLLGKFWFKLNPREKTALYYLRVALLATFTAWALKTKAYKKY